MSEKPDADQDFMVEALEEEERVEHGFPEKPAITPQKAPSSSLDTGDT